jgi:predicted transposase YdaD
VHDHLFRHAFSVPLVVEQFLRVWLLPELLPAVDWETLTVCNISGINRSLRERREDVICKVQIAGREVWLYFLIEHQTQPDEFMAYRMGEYTMLTWQDVFRAERKRENEEKREGEGGGRQRERRGRRGKLPIVLPMVIYPGPGRWGRVTRLAELVDIPETMSSDTKNWLRSVMPDCGFVLVELDGVPLEKLADGKLARAVLGALQARRHGKRDDALAERLIREMFDEKDATAVNRIYRQLWHYLIVHFELSQPAIERIVDKFVPEEKQKDFMSTMERLLLEGQQKGWKEGQQKGWKEGQQTQRIIDGQHFVIDALETRHGSVPGGLIEEIERITDSDRLHTLHRAAIRSNSIEEFTGAL